MDRRLRERHLGNWRQSAIAHRESVCRGPRGSPAGCAGARPRLESAHELCVRDGDRLAPEPRRPTPEDQGVFGHVTGQRERRDTLRAIGRALAAFGLPGVYFRPCVFMPTFHIHANQACGGIQIHVTEREAFEQTVATARVVLDESIFVKEWNTGTRLTHDEAIDDALSDVTS